MEAEKISAHLHHVPVYSHLRTIDPVQKSYQAFSSSTQENPSGKLSGKTKKEGEIGVFSAEKYFSMKLDDSGPAQNDSCHGQYQHKQENPENLHWKRPRSRPGTPSIRSESSYSSQTVLLRSFMRDNNQLQSQRRKINETSVFFGGLRCNGPCSDGKSVHVNPNLNHAKKEIPRKRKQLYKPGLHMKNEPRFHVTPGFGKKTRGSMIEEIFPLTIEKADIAVNLERKLSMLTWDAIPNAPNYLQVTNNNNSVRSHTCEDIESDASSDLFEIENITGVYEPSEASIEWSVTTRSAADNSVASYMDGKKLAGNKIRNPVTGSAKIKSSMEKGRSGGLLSGCKSHKAVNIVETAYKNEKQQLQRSERKLQAGIMVKDLNFL